MEKSQTAQDALNDLGYLRALAEGGRNAPLLGGRFAVMWGILVSSALVLNWMILAGHTNFDPQAVLFVWLGMGGIGAIGSVILGRSLQDKPGCGSFSNQVESTVWSAGGFSIFIYWLAIMAGVLFGKANYEAFASIMVMAFCIYGVCYFTTAKLSQNRAIYGIAALCFIAAIISGALINQAISFLIAAIFVVLTTVIPGIISMRREPAQII